uniref:Uncharacterized protein n=1 Tax=Terrapene triunguis TaxID=2587831 RepID=A0A674J183_9SAUR
MTHGQSLGPGPGRPAGPGESAWTYAQPEGAPQLGHGAALEWEQVGECLLQGAAFNLCLALLEEWAGVSKDVVESFKPNYSESFCYVSELSPKEGSTPLWEGRDKPRSGLSASIASPHTAPPPSVPPPQC